MTSLGLSFLTGKMGTVRLAPSWQGIERTQEVMHVMHLLFKICIYLFWLCWVFIAAQAFP